MFFHFNSSSGRLSSVQCSWVFFFLLLLRATLLLCHTGLSCTLCRGQMSRTEEYQHTSCSDCLGQMQPNISVCTVVVWNRLNKCFYRLGTYLKLQILWAVFCIPTSRGLFVLLLSSPCTVVCLCLTLQRWKHRVWSPWRWHRQPPPL